MMFECSGCDVVFGGPFYDALIGCPPVFVRGHRKCIEILKADDEKTFNEQERIVETCKLCDKPVHMLDGVTLRIGTKFILSHQECWQILEENK